MPRRFFDHTGDVGVTLSAPTLPALFREAALAFSDTLTDPDEIRPTLERTVELAAPRLDDLMVSWLDELLYLFEVQNVLVGGVEVGIVEIDGGWRLQGVARGEAFDEARHQIKVLIKGVTYHRLDVRHEAGEWRTDVVFDI